MKKTIWQVRRDGTTWKQSFKTRQEARDFKAQSWRFKKEGYIVKIVTERVS